MQDRLIDFERVLNFRDFGGWETEDGAKIARGKLFRSAAFNDASAADLARLDAMELRFLVDLRRPEERKHEPNKWVSEACRHIFKDDGVKSSELAPHLIALMQSDLTPQSTREYMMELYRSIPFDPRLVSLYRDWFAELSEGGAGVIHCAAGKDRTGVGCALTLMALGVDEEAVFADYDFTNQAVDLATRMPRIQERMEERLGKKLDPEALKPMLGVHVDYLREALNVIEAKHGSAIAYIDEVLGVGPAGRAALKEKLSV